MVVLSKKEKQIYQNHTIILQNKMENNLERLMEELMEKPGVIGCVFADHQGLCLGAKGKASTDSAGIIAALAEQAAKLDPSSKPPVIHFENDSHSCIINKGGDVTVAIFKNNHN